MRLIDNNYYCDLRIVRGSKASVGRDVLAGLAELLRCAGLARDAVADNISVFRRAFVDDAAHHLGDFCRGLLAYHLTPDGRLGLADDIAVVVEHFRDDIGLHQLSAVGYGGECSHHLNGRDLERLTERGAREVDERHALVGVVSDARLGLSLRREVDSGLFGEAERLEIFVEIINAEALTHGYEIRVAGFFQTADHVERTVNGVRVAVVGLGENFYSARHAVDLR